jgi:catechol 2,3-dioxygenase-like lactoylglutathione lyase family enzyme
MGIDTFVAQVSCSDLRTSLRWYEKLFGRPPLRRPAPGLAEWGFADHAQVQLSEAPAQAGQSTLTLGVLPIAPQQTRLRKAGLNPGPILRADDLFVLRLRDPDGNLVVVAGAERG